MAQIQPPNTQVVRPQHLTQVGHEGNPVETCVLAVTGTLDATTFHNCEVTTTEGPAVYPVIGSGSGGGGSEVPNLPLGGGGGGGNCYVGNCAVIFVTGGAPPYTFSVDVGVFAENESGNGGTVCHDPAAGGVGGVGDQAYGKQVKFCCTFTNCVKSSWDCAGNQLTNCTSVGASICGLGSCSCSSCSGCTNLSFCSTAGSCNCSVDPCVRCCGTCTTSETCTGLEVYGTECDIRDAGITCQPCQIQFQDGAVVTVTDSNGTILLIPLEWSTDETE